MGLEGVYKFVKWEVPKLDTLKNTKPYKLYKKLIIEKKKPTREEKDYLFRELFSNVYSNTGISLQGWFFPFRSILKEYWVKDRYGYIHSYYAPDKQSIRNTISSIVKVVEIKNRNKLKELI